MVTLVGVCHFLYLIILVSYKLFGLFLVHKISAYKYIYENGEKKWEKKKKKGIPASWAGGDFGPPGRERARACGPAVVHGRGDDAGAWERRRHCGPTRQRERRGGGRRHGLTARVNRPSAGREPGRRWPGSWSTGMWLSTGRGWRS
jgi:hypothetical protein